jgi:cyclopropane fatty-acyl-phospholipid synthase-like methyltransferase
VVDPRVDYESLYDAAYYQGKGADPLVSYEAEVADHRTIRAYEWQGIVELVSSLHPVGPATRWLDFGCGLGGLVRHLRREGIADAWGHDQGYAGSRMATDGLPVLDVDGFSAASGTFEVITAIEVIEHVTDPVGLLRQLADLLAPGGLLFLTTGNSRPYRGRLSSWRYVLPDIHVAFFEPSTVAAAYARAGLQPVALTWGRGHEQIVRYKVLKNLRRRRRSPLDRLLPTTALRAVDRRFGLLAHPAATLIDQPWGDGTSTST